MNWLLVIIIIVFTPENEPVLANGGAFIVESEKICTDKAKEIHKEMGKPAFVYTSCDPIKDGKPIERKRGSNI